MCKSDEAAQGAGCGFIVETWRGDRWGASAHFDSWEDAQNECKRLTNLCEWPDGKAPQARNMGN